MKNAKLWSVVAVAAVLACGSIALGDDEDAMAKAPAPVQAAAKAILGKNKLAGFDPETENGKTVYEVSIEIAGGGDCTVVIASDGSIIEREVEIDKSMVPPDVMAAATKAHADGVIGETAIVNADGKLFYEIETKVAKDNHEVKIDATGKVLSDTVAAPEAKDAAEKPEADEKK